MLREGFTAARCDLNLSLPVSSLHTIALISPVLLFQNLGGYNSVLRPRVVGEWVGREEVDADPLAAEMLHPPVPRTKTEVCWSGDNSPAGRWAVAFIHTIPWSHLRTASLKTSEKLRNLF